MKTRGGIINASVRNYMIKDLILLSIIGFVLEFLCTKFASLAIASTVTMSFSFFIVFVAVVRWNCYGLLTIPILVAATILGGRFTDVHYLRPAYDWHVYVATSIALTTIGLDVIPFKIFGTKKTVSNVWILVLMIFVNFFVANLVQLFVYRICCGNITGNVIPSSYTHYDSELGENVTVTINLCKYIESGLVYNLFGLAIAVIGVLVLRSQGAVSNVVEKLIDDKKEMELIRENTEGFSISEISKSNESDSSEKEEDTND